MAREIIEYEALKEKMANLAQHLQTQIKSLKLQLGSGDAKISSPDEKNIYEINHRLKGLEELEKKLNNASSNLSNEFSFYKIAKKDPSSGFTKKFKAFIKHPVKVTSALSKLRTYKKEKKIEFIEKLKKANTHLSFLSNELEKILSERVSLQEEKKRPPMAATSESPPGTIGATLAESSSPEARSSDSHETQVSKLAESSSVTTGPAISDTQLSDSTVSKHDESKFPEVGSDRKASNDPFDPSHETTESFTVSWPEKKEKKLPENVEQKSTVKWHFKSSASTTSIDHALHAASSSSDSVKDRLTTIKKEREAAKTLEVFLTQLKHTVAYEKQKVEQHKVAMNELTISRLGEDKIILSALQSQVTNPHLLEEASKLEKTIDSLIHSSAEIIKTKESKNTVTFHRRKGPKPGSSA